MLHTTIIFLALTTVYVQSDAPAQPPPPPPPACSSEPPKDKPSIKLDKFELFDDCKTLCDELTDKWIKNPKTITKLLCHRSFDQRNQIQQTFPSKCDNRVLLDKIKHMKLMMEQCKDLMAKLLTPPALIYKQAIEEEKCKNNKDDVITWIMCSINNKEKTDLLKEYPDLQKVLEEYASKGGDGYKALLLGACFNQRKETPDPKVTPEMIEREANELRTKNGPDFVSKLKEIIGKYGDPELKQIFLKYSASQQDGNVADKVLTSFQGKEMEAYLVFVRSIENKYTFYAITLNHCIKGNELNSNLDCVDRIVTLRCEIDLGNIAEAYKSLFKEKFADDFKYSVNVDTVYFEAIKKLLGDFE